MGIQFTSELGRALSAVAGEGHLKIVKYLIEQGALMGIQFTNDINIALNTATRGGHLKVMEYLMAQGPYDLNQAIYGAAEGGHLEIFKSLIELKIFDSAKVEPVPVLVGTGQGIQFNDLNITISKSLNYVAEGINKYSVIERIDKERKEIERREIVEYLISLAARNGIQFTNDFGNMLSAAAENGHLEIVKYLIDHYNIQTNDLNNALLKGVRWGNLEITKYLVEHEASDLNRVLIAVGSKNRLLIIEHLMSQGATDLKRGLRLTGEDIHAYLNYLIDNPQTQVINYLEISNKLIQNQKIDTQIIHYSSSDGNSILVLTDKEGKKYIAVVKYDNSTNEVAPPKYLPLLEVNFIFMNLNLIQVHKKKTIILIIFI